MKRKYTTQTTNGTAGRLAEPGPPVEQVLVCVSLPATRAQHQTTYHETVEGVEVENINGTNLEMTVSTADPTGKCP